MAPPRKVRRSSISRGQLVGPDVIPELEVDMPIPAHNVINTVVAGALEFVAGRQSGDSGFTIPALTTGPQPQGSLNGDGVCPPGFTVAVDHCTGQIICKKTRRRRKRLLTCSDKADIAFLTGTLGKGQLAQTAISSLLSRCG